jgi:hypothetical protein
MLFPILPNHFGNPDWTAFSGVNPTPTQLYRVVDVADFPVGPYLLMQTGKGISRFFQVSNEVGNVVLNHSGLLSLLDEMGYVKIYQSNRVEYREFEDTVYELKTDGGITLAIVDERIVGSKVGDDSDDINLNGSGAFRLISNDESSFEKTLSLLKKSDFIKNETPKANFVGLIVKSQMGYEAMPFELPKQKIDIGMNYGDSFIPVHEKIKSTLSEKGGKGLVLLHGTPGTGKTHYLKHLASQIEGKRILFVPPYLVDFITSPEMTPFLIHNANSILFIEDAERVITDRNENGSVGVANILNITDGILSDILKIQIVATFNMDKQKIDKALLRKGRLIAEHQFEKLGVDDTNRLIGHLGLDYVSDVGMTLTEIYNLNEVEYKSKEEPKRKVGFGS